MVLFHVLPVLSNSFVTEKLVDEAEEEKPPEPEGPPKPLPGSEEWEYVEEALDKVRTVNSFLLFLSFVLICT